MTLQGRVVLVTGAARRVGRTIALAFASKGARIAAHYHSSRSDALELLKGIRSLSGSDAAAFQADLNLPNAPKRLASAVARHFGGIDVLVNSASLYERTPLETLTVGDWDRHMNINARAPYFLALACAPWLKRGKGAIINIADWNGQRPNAEFGPYCASKAALLCANRLLAKSLAPEIRVNAVIPGPVLPPDNAGEQEAAAMAKATLLKRLGSPEAVARACVFLAESADYSTGSELTVDGGRALA